MHCDPNRRDWLKTVAAGATGVNLVLPTNARSQQPGGAAGAIEINARRELFVDDFLIDRLEGTRLKLHEPRPAGVCLTYPEPWEGVFSSYNTIIHDGDVYRMYYMGMSAGHRYTCYAESTDGVHWEKPHLRIHEVLGTRDNNVVLIDRNAGTNFAPFLDANSDARDSQRFKSFAVRGGLVPYASADGLHWKPMHDGPVITQGAFDSHNIPFFSAAEGCYVCYFRTFRNGGYRWIDRATSQDFLHWSDPEPMQYGDTPAEHLYTSSTTPYFRAPHLYVALPSRFMEGSDAVTQQQKSEIGVHEMYVPSGSGFSDMPLMTTRGGNSYQRTFMESFIPVGIGLRNWTSRANYPAVGIVATPDSQTEMSIYVSREIGYPTVNLTRYTLRYDGFISVHAPFSGGELVTRPLRFEGDRLSINYATSAPGSVSVEIQDANGRPIPGFTAGDCREIIGDEIDRIVSWTGGPDVSSLAGRPIRLRFSMQAADLYALQFQNTG